MNIFDSFLILEKQEDEEFVLQILYLFLCLFYHQKLAVLLCSDDNELIEYLIKSIHDKNDKIRTISNQILQIVVVLFFFFLIKILTLNLINKKKINF